jgi:thiamine-monophosphate kinase
MKSWSENRLIAWLRQRAGVGTQSLLGDDGAILELRGEVAVTVDQQIEGVHFPSGLDPALVARRLLRVNLSDLAAMGAAPRHALLAIAAPPEFDHRRFFAALLRECRRYGVVLAGGDLARAAQVSATMTLLGARRPGSRWLRRAEARPGDGLWVGGTLGEAALGCRLIARGAMLGSRAVALPADLPAALAPAARRAVRRHLLPEPQLELSAWLARQRRAAALDVSDGLARDLHRLCRESGVGARLDSGSLPLSRDAAGLADWLGDDALDLALAGGEDYVLLVALPARIAPPTAWHCRRVGQLTSDRRLQMKTGGAWRPLRDVGFDHLARGEGRSVRRSALGRRSVRASDAPRRAPG